MKKSNYILIAIFTLVIASILTYFITCKQHEGEDSRYLKIVDIPLSDFKVIVAEDSVNFNIRSREQNQLSLRYVEKKQKFEDAYRVSNDTLYIKSQIAYQIYVFCKQADISVIAQKDSRINVWDCKLNKLTIENIGGYIDLRDNTFDILRIQAIDCKKISLFNNHAGFVSAEIKNIDDFSFLNNHFDNMEIGIKK